jgi:NAD(P)H-dependent nitrite reductase small subunit
MNNGFVKVCKLNELKEKEGKRILIDDVEVALFKVYDKVYALSNICPHQHTTLIYDGFIEDNYVICPLHGWEFNLETGNMLNNSRGLDVFETLIEDGIIYVKVFKKKNNW